MARPRKELPPELTEIGHAVLTILRVLALLLAAGIAIEFMG